jgi:hypothetical protein
MSESKFLLYSTILVRLLVPVSYMAGPSFAMDRNGIPETGLGSPKIWETYWTSVRY